jgi:glucose-6-phosphate isomerase
MSLELWERYQRYLCSVESVGVSVDVSRMKFGPDFFERMRAPLAQAFDAMQALEQGAIANVDERRMVGHYWLRAPELAPSAELREAIESALHKVRAFAQRVHEGALKPERAAQFKKLLVVGIGGSALGPQLAADALGGERDRMQPFFFDNTDPDGFDRVLARIGAQLNETLCVVISKSGGTKETRNGMLEAARAYAERGLSFAKHAVAVTGEGSELDQLALREGWLERFPMWDWVGGRTSQLSAVGLLPAALQGLDIDGLLAGARAMDEATRARDALKNPAALLASMWFYAGHGRGAKDMVVLPYKDRLLLFSRYLQQLVMESLGKQHDLSGKLVNQGLAVYGNKGSTDQHAYVQQLREGLDNFFVTFILVRRDRAGGSLAVEPDVTSGDYLFGFLLGTRRALYENGRESITLSVPDTSARTLGALIALYERTVGLYASLIDVNAYHQPGVEAGKRAAASLLAQQHALLAELRSGAPARTAEQLAAAIGAPEEVESVHLLLEHMADNPDHGVRREAGADPFQARYVSLAGEAAR